MVCERKVFSLGRLKKTARLACGIIDQLVEAGRLDKLLINLNVPDLSGGPAKGIRVCHMTIPSSQEEMTRRTDPRGRLKTVAGWGLKLGS